jgi:hypothetical protein
MYILYTPVYTVSKLRNYRFTQEFFKKNSKFFKNVGTIWSRTVAKG